MDILDEELIRFWESLAKNSVVYIMVGGFALNMHGYTRSTNDIDLWLKDEIPNRRNFGKAMAQFGYEEINWDEIQFVPGWSEFYIGPGIRLDIMTTMKGLDHISFDEAYHVAKIATIEGNKVPFLHINQLIANKKAVNKPKDRIDIIELEKIKKILDETTKDDIS